MEKLGGTVFCKFYNPLALKDCVDGRTDRTQAAPIRRTDICKFPFALLFLPLPHIYLQCGTLSGRTEVICQQKRWKRCPLSKIAGGSFPSNSEYIRHKDSSRKRSRLLYTGSMLMCWDTKSIWIMSPCGLEKCCDSVNDTDRHRSPCLVKCSDFVNGTVIVIRCANVRDFEKHIENRYLRLGCFWSDF